MRNLLNQTLTITPVTGEDYHGAPTLGTPITVQCRKTHTVVRNIGVDRNMWDESIQVWAVDERLKDYDMWLYNGKVSSSIQHHAAVGGAYSHTTLVW